MEKMTALKMHSINRKQVYKLIYANRGITRTQLSETLELSLPTISQHLKALEDEGLIERCGHFGSTGGRKPDIYRCIGNARIAIGIHIRKPGFTIVAVDLYGNILGLHRVSESYRHTDEYYQRVGEKVNEFIDTNGYNPDSILGIGIALTALLSKDRKEIKKSILLGEKKAKIDDFAKWLSYPCQMFHDSEAAASGEMWFSKNISDALYLGLNHHLNGTLIINGAVHEGKEYAGGLVEHMTLIPGGEECYCGRRGCFSAYCSTRKLFDDDDGSRETFFTRLRSGEADEARKWKAYLKNLSMAVGSLYPVLDCDIIMGGDIGSYMNEQDIREIQEMALAGYEFAPEADFIRLGHEHPSISASGAAIYYIAEFLEN